MRDGVRRQLHSLGGNPLDRIVVGPLVRDEERGFDRAAVGISERNVDVLKLTTFSTCIWSAGIGEDSLGMSLR